MNSKLAKLYIVSVYLLWMFNLTVQQQLGPSEQPEAFFNGSSYIRLETTISLKRHTSFSFRSCAGGELFSQQRNDYLIELSVNPEDVLFRVRTPEKYYEARIPGNYLNNRWHVIHLIYKLGNLTLTVNEQSQLLANSTYNSELLTSLELYDDGAILIVGNHYNGCILEGPSVTFNSSLIHPHNVIFGTCPIPMNSCVPREDLKESRAIDYCTTEPCMRHGSCQNGQNSYTCICLPRYSGKNCEIDLGSLCEKDPNLCKNGGTCHENNGNYNCNCLPGFEEQGFAKAQSDNLPRVDAEMVADYFRKNDCFALPETRGVKTDKAGRQSYGDTAIGWVQVCRVKELCIVKAKITPEHNVRKKHYNVSFTVNETLQEIVTAECQDCAASAGGCKHAAALLMWLHRRSEEPSPTEVTCYWKKSKLSKVGTSLKYLTLQQFGEKEELPSDDDSENFFKEVLSVGDEHQCDSQLFKHFTVDPTKENLGLYQLMLSFVRSGESDSKQFFNYCSRVMKADYCTFAANNTVSQSDSSLWYELRYARITASKMYQAAHCKTADGTFVNQVIGVEKLRDTKAMKRGRKLEKKVIETLAEQLGVHFKFTGLRLCPEHPVIGGSPDAICDEYVVEIKCPESEKNLVNYITKDKRVASRHKAQLQVLMFIFKKKRALFCVADPNFEKNNKLEYIFVNYDPDYTDSIISAAENFWLNNIFKILYDSATK